MNKCCHSRDCLLKLKEKVAGKIEANSHGGVRWTNVATVLCFGTQTWPHEREVLAAMLSSNSFLLQTISEKITAAKHYSS